MFCKQLLGVQRQTNVGVLLELGQVPLNIYAKKVALKNWERISFQKKTNYITIKSYEFALKKILIGRIGMMQSFQGDHKTYEKAFTRMGDIFIKKHSQR